MGNAVKVKAQKCSVSALKDLVAFAGHIGPGVDKTGLTGVYDFHPVVVRGRRPESRLGLAGSTGIAGETGEGAGRPVCSRFRTKAHAQLGSRFYYAGTIARRACSAG